MPLAAYGYSPELFWSRCNRRGLCAIQVGDTKTP